MIKRKLCFFLEKEKYIDNILKTIKLLLKYLES